MPIAPMKQIIDRAFNERYGVAAINVFNDLTLEAVLTAAQELRAPLIVQTSVKTVKQYGPGVIIAMFRAMTDRIDVPVTLHLDHCPDRAVISTCLKAGWNSVLFDAHELSVEENRRQTIEVVAEAHAAGAAVEGEIEGIEGVEDGLGSDEAPTLQPLGVALDFIRATEIDCFAPAIGNKHGTYKREPKLDANRVTDLVAAEPIPMALHGGTGLTPEQFHDLIARGCSKVNISTAMKIAYIQANREFLEANPNNWDPPSLLKHVLAACKKTAADHIALFGGAGKAA